MINLSLTEQEAGALQQLLDAAVRGLGLQGAEAAVFFAKKIGAAVEAAKKVAPQPEAAAQDNGAPTPAAEAQAAVA